MAAISETFGQAGGNTTGGGAGEPTQAEVLRDIADDLAGVQVALITSPDGSDAGSVQTLVNEIKASLNVVAGFSLLTTKV